MLFLYLGKMALSWLMVFEHILYGVCFICGIITSASVTVSQGEFAGQCILYGTVKCNSSVGECTATSFSNVSLCYFVCGVSVFVSLYCFAVVLHRIYTIFIGETTRESVWMNFYFACCGIFVFFLLICSCILQVGFDKLCTSILENKEIKSCSDAQQKSWATPYKGSLFYTNIYSAKSADWVNFFLWIVILGLLIVQKRKESEFRPLSASDPEWSTAENEPIVSSKSRQS
ncbi:transmembrane protein 179B [Protopterus annectens]|uniref:transmembrane protein 179B n=1 Tax=Protopterus annectens TaxID=7888 RepID=UPI001CF9ECFC|nr:transmembrane protein 179B [Protopterus annectens]